MYKTSSSPEDGIGSNGIMLVTTQGLVTKDLSSQNLTHLYAIYTMYRGGQRPCSYNFWHIVSLIHVYIPSRCYIPFCRYIPYHCYIPSVVTYRLVVTYRFVVTYHLLLHTVSLLHTALLLHTISLFFNTVNPVRIRVRIDPSYPLVCRKRRLIGAVLRNRGPVSQQVSHDKDPYLLKGPERRAQA
jgi:hypothetical protein